MNKVVLVGRPNVGKSTLFNRLLGYQRSIVEETSGVTRDRIEVSCAWSGKRFTLVDTGGILKSEQTLNERIQKQSFEAIRTADLVVLVMDLKEGWTHADEEALRELRPLLKKKEIILVANKADTSKTEAMAAELYGLGFGEPALVSALHGRGVGDLLDRIGSHLPGDEAEAETDLQICLLGRPNVGKSSLFNALLGESRVIVHDEPGTTRDAIDVHVTADGKPVTLVDTAGLRKRSKATESIEYFSRTRTVKALRRSHVALFVIDASEGILVQDKHLAGEIHESGKALVIVANKWDKVSLRGLSPDGPARFVQAVQKEFRFVNYAPILPVSALTEFDVDKIFPAAFSAYAAWKQRLRKDMLKKLLAEAVFLSPPPSSKGKEVRFKGVSQIADSPPTFLLKTGGKGTVPDFYLRYLEGKFRETFDLAGTPIRLVAERAISKRR